jgi:6-phosphogluconolactonase
MLCFSAVRDMAFWALLASLSGLSSAAALAARDDKPEKLWVFIGTYTGKNSKGIYRCTLDLASGQLTNPVLAGEATNPSFLAIHPNHRFLYAVGEIGNFGGKKSGGVSAFTIDPATGNLTALNQQSSGGADPCHIVVDKDGKHVLVANYTGGSACAVAILKDGKLGDSTAFAQHAGSSVNKQRQEAPHAHSINLDAANRFAFVADLGLDRVVIYKFDKASGNLKMNDPPFVSTAPGAGPRHFAFHPSGKTAYVINELENTINVLTYDPARGELKVAQTISTLPKDFTGKSNTAEVQVHPTGKFVYGSNRGHNSIAIFAVDSSTGELSAVGHQAHNIKTPRNFAIDPTGAFLIVANQDGNSLIVFRINPQTGELTSTGSTVECPMPVCVKMMPVGG